MEDNRMLRLTYTFFLGLLLAIFVGVGINTFYPAPKAPEYPAELNTISKEPTQEQIANQRQFDIQMQKHNKDMQPYNRNVSVITLVASVILLTVSLMFEKKLRFLSDGVLCGGLFTLLYSIGRGFASEDSKYVFIMVSISLIIAIYLGYHRFVGPKNFNPKELKT